MKQHYSPAVVCFIAFYLIAPPSEAILVATETSANNLAKALMPSDTGLTIINSTLSGQSTNGAFSTGTYTNASGTYGISDGIILSTGNVSNYSDGPNTSPSTATFYSVPATDVQEALLDPITGSDLEHYDVTQLDIRFTTANGELYLDMVFGSEEFDEFVGSEFIDVFGIYLDGTNIAKVDDIPVTINHTYMTSLAGTELDGILAPGGNPLLRLYVTGLDASNRHTLTFIIADTSDIDIDTTVYLANLRGKENHVSIETPVPAAIWLFGSGLIGMYGTALIKRPTH